MTVQVAGTIAYGFLDTHRGIKLVGSTSATIPVIGPPIGNVFIAVADATQNVAYAVAKPPTSARTAPPDSVLCNQERLAVGLGANWRAVFGWGQTVKPRVVAYKHI